MVIPAGAVAGPGTLSVKSSSAAGGGLGPKAKSWSIDLDGSTLTGTATVKFPLTEPVASGVPIVGYLDGKRRLHVVPSRVEGDKVVVSTTHFSEWVTDSSLWLQRQALAGLDRLVDGALDIKPPTCVHEKPAREHVKIESDSGTRVKWCVGIEGRARVVKVTNTRGHAVAVESTPGLRLADDRNALDRLIPGVSELVEAPSKKANQLHLLASGETFTFIVSESAGTAGLKINPSVSGYLVSAFLYGVDTALLVAKLKPGGDVRREQIIKAIGVVKCVGTLAGTKPPDSPGTAAKLMADALDLTFGCIDEKLLAELIGNGIWLQPIVSVGLWLVSGVRSAVSGVVAAGDTWADVDGYQLVLTPATKVPPPTQPTTSIPLGATASFQHFDVTVLQLWNTTGQGLLVKAKVCVKKLPPDPQGNATRVSWNPWTVRIDGRTTRPSLHDGSHPPADQFPAEGLHRVGTCASGWIPFSGVSDDQPIDQIRYANGVGDLATWNPGPVGRTPTDTMRVSWTYPAPFIPNDYERFSTKTLDGPTARFEAPADFHRVYQVRNLRWQGWNLSAATGHGQARLCAETCSNWRAATIKLTKIRTILCGENEKFHFYTRYQLTGFGDRDGATYESPAFC